jgi:hypothetical protein
MLFRKRGVQFPMFGIRPRDIPDRRMLEYSITNGRSRFTVSFADTWGDPDIFPIFSADCVCDVVLDEDQMSQGADSELQRFRRALDTVYVCYLTAFTRFEYFIRLTCGVKHLPPDMPERMESFVRDWECQTAEGKWLSVPKTLKQGEIPRDHPRNPLFQDRELITLEKWAAFRSSAEGDEPINEFRLELERIRSRLLWGGRKIATVEAVIVIETLLRDYCLEELRRRGFSNKRLDDLDEHFTFSSLTNLIAPLLLGEQNALQLANSLHRINRLRKVRNDIMHNALPENDIPTDDIDAAIDAVLEIGLAITNQRRLSGE